MRTIEIKLYKFDELSEEAQEKALDHCRYFEVDHEWWEALYEDAKNVGIEITCFNHGNAKTIEGKPIEDYATIKKLIMENHGNKCSTYLTVKNHDLRVEDEGEDMFASLLEDYLILLEKDYEYLISDEAIKENLIANEYEFTENGEFH